MKRRWFQFNLRTLLGALTLVAVATGLVMRHVQFVQQRIHYHEARLANCEERIMMRQDPNWLSSRWRDATSQIDQQLPRGHLLWNAPLTLNANERLAILQARNREIEQLKVSRDYCQRQIRQYRLVLWRPWIHVQETGKEIVDLLPEIAPEASASVSIPPRLSAPITSPQKSADTESIPKPKVRRGWQPIERPLPRDFNNRDLQLEKTSDRCNAAKTLVGRS